MQTTPTYPLRDAWVPMYPAQVIERDDVKWKASAIVLFHGGILFVISLSRSLGFRIQCSAEA